MEFIVGLIVGVVSAFILATFEKNKFMFEKKCEKYSKFIELYQEAVAATKDNAIFEKHRQAVVFARRQVSLISTSEIDCLTKKIFDTPIGEQSELMEEIVVSMKKDLDNYKNIINWPPKRQYHGSRG